jgi:ribonucleoside-diphosphate reductase alpha chain
MTARERLPNRRAAETFNLECAGLPYTATVGRFDDGRLAEIFISNHKAGSAADTAARDAAIAASIALQFGADAETIRKALCRDTRRNAKGPLGVALDLLAAVGSRGVGPGREVATAVERAAVEARHCLVEPPDYTSGPSFGGHRR